MVKVKDDGTILADNTADELAELVNLTSYLTYKYGNEYMQLNIDSKNE